MLQAAASGALPKLSTEHADRTYIITLVMSMCEHAGEWRHGPPPGSVECVQAAVMTAQSDVKPCSLWRLNVQEIEWFCRYDMISSLYGGRPMNQNIRHNQSQRNKELPSGNRAYNVYLG